MFGSQATNVRNLVTSDLLLVREKVKNEVLHIFSADRVSDEAKGRRLMLLLQQDLLPGISGKILEGKSRRDYHLPAPVPIYAKYAGWTVVVGTNFALLFYVYLFAMTQTGSAQNAWFFSFILWFIMDILFVGTGLVYITHIFVPSFTMKDIHKIRSKLLDAIEKYKSSLHEEEAIRDAVTFNASNFFFVSTQVAKMYPELKESQIILKFSTPWPRQSYKYESSDVKVKGSKLSIFGRSISIVLVFAAAGMIHTSLVIQDLFSNIVVTAIVGTLVMWNVDLYNINPLLAGVPWLFVGILVHFAIATERNHALLALQEQDKERRARISPKLPKVAAIESVTGVVDGIFEGEESDSSGDFSYTSLPANGIENYEQNDSSSEEDEDVSSHKEEEEESHGSAEAVDDSVDGYQSLSVQNSSVLNSFLCSESDFDIDIKFENSSSSGASLNYDDESEYVVEHASGESSLLDGFDLVLLSEKESSSDVSSGSDSDFSN